jgi:hypothetical protein
MRVTLLPNAHRTIEPDDLAAPDKVFAHYAK